MSISPLALRPRSSVNLSWGVSLIYDDICFCSFLLASCVRARRLWATPAAKWLDGTSDGISEGNFAQTRHEGRPMLTYVGQLREWNEIKNKSLSDKCSLETERSTSYGSRNPAGIPKNVFHHGQFNGTRIETEKLCGHFNNWWFPCQQCH